MLVGSITTRESEWDQEQVDLHLAYELYRRGIGPNGELLTEATDPAADPMEYGPYRYVARGPFTNWAEKERKDAEALWKKEYGADANLNGMFWTVEKVELPPQP